MQTRTFYILGALIIGSAAAYYFGAFEMIKAARQPRVVKTAAVRAETPVAKPSPSPSSSPATQIPEAAPPRPAIVPATPAPLATPPSPPAVDLKALALDPAQWPRQITLLQPHTFPAMLNGKVIGSMKAPAGMVVMLVTVQENALVVEYQGARHSVTPAATDLISRVLAARALPVSPPVPNPVPVAAAPRPEDASAHSHLIFAKPPYSDLNQPLAHNPDFPPSRNPAYIKMAQLMAQRTGEPKPPYRPQPLDFVACIERYEALAAPAKRSRLVKELANDLRQIAWQFENGPFIGKCMALDAAQIAAKTAFKSLKDKELALAITETFIWPNYHLASMRGSITNFTEEQQIEKAAYIYENCGALDRAVVALNALIAKYNKGQFLNQADSARIMLSYVYREQKKYTEAAAIIKEVTDEALVSIKEDIPALKAASEKQTRAAKKP